MPLGWNSDLGGWTVEGFDMCTPAWKPLNLEVLWVPGPARGSSVIIPGASGRTARPRRVDEATRDVWMQIVGDVDSAGTPTSSVLEGLEGNLDDLIAGAVTPPTLPTVTRTSVLTMPSGATRSAEVHIDAQPPSRSAQIIHLVLTVTIPAGAHI